MTATVVISVFGLFHPVELEVQPARQAITVHCANRPQRLEGAQRLKLVEGCSIERSRFILSVPHKIRREFEGSLRIERPGATLLALVEMDLETAVAAVVAAEMPLDAPAEALAAQAIAARSYFAAKPQNRHPHGFYCDTTHCQHNKGVIAMDHPAAKAAHATRGMILEYESRVVRALYSAACLGRRQAGEVDGYRYEAVECSYCRRKPAPKRGLHEYGLCQAGAIDLARMGKDATAILAHYYPGTRIAVRAD